MPLDQLAVLLLTGIANAASLFLVASGLSLIFGVTRIVNFAHGSFYMLGAYIAFQFMDWLAPGPLGFWGCVVLAALAVGVIGVVVELSVLRWIYRSPELFQLIATFGVILIVQDATQALWGTEDKLGPRAPGLSGAVTIGSQRIPQYDLALIALAPVVLFGVIYVLRRTRWGVLVRAATLDREMVGALGVNQNWLFTSVFFLGSVLAGLGGATQVPREAVSLQMDLNIIADAFVVVVVGGMGSLGGAFLAALLIAVLKSFATVFVPELNLVVTFLIMAVVLVVRPWGLLGRAETAQRLGEAAIDKPLRPAGTRLLALYAAVGILLLVWPWIGGEFARILGVEILIFALFAASLHFMMGPGGMASFGHAAYFGLGAYGAALLVKYLAATMEPALIAAPIAGAAAALVFGWFCVRLSGVYLAMLTLAFAQIAWSVVFGWDHITGGDDGILGVRRAEWLRDPTVFYYFTLLICAGGIAALRRILFAPFGYTMRAGRDSPLRADAIGIDVRRSQWLAFVVAGGFAGAAGGLYLFSKGNVFPNVVAIPQSIDALLMVLLGGVNALAGPIVGAGAITWLEHELPTHFEYWRWIFGLIVVLTVVLFPRGIAGSLRELVGERLGFVRRET
jgi:branched-chain amino acid transport system permease protein